MPPNLVDGLNRDDAPRTDWTLLVGQLDRLGRLVATGEWPLIVVLKTALPYVEATDLGRELGDVIKEIETQYVRDEPGPELPAVKAPPPGMVATKIPEAIIHGDDRVPYEFVERALTAAASVARIAVPFRGGNAAHRMFGTGWLIGRALLITNHHVIAGRGERPTTRDECRAQAAEAQVWFDYRVEGGRHDARAVDELVCMNAELDYAIVRLQPGTVRRPLAIARDRRLLVKGDRLNIVQHPLGGALKYAIRGNHYLGTAGPSQEHFLRYLTDTEPGSSGSPVLDDTWRVVALHHAWASVPAQQHQGQVTYVNNEGIAIHSILQDLPKAIRDEIAAAQQWSPAAGQDEEPR